jgi:hypothetical protein
LQHDASSHAADLAGLAATLGAIAAGPLVARVFQGQSSVARACSAAVPAAVAALVAVHLVPHALVHAGLAGLFAVLLGAAAPLAAEVIAARAPVRRNALFALLVVLLALTPHFLLDGLALVDHHAHAHGHGGAGGSHGARVAAVAMHTLPLSALLWVTALHAGGARVAALSVAWVGGFTVTGFAAGAMLVPALSIVGGGLLDGFVAGTLLHVSAHSVGRVGPGDAAGSRRGATVAGAALGALSAAGLLAMTDHAHGPDGVGPLILVASVLLSAAIAFAGHRGARALRAHGAGAAAAAGTAIAD